MAKIYYELIKRGLKSIDNVSPVWRAQVQALLDADNETPNT